jgi:XTP/dITP diphosphohydrolase
VTRRILLATRNAHKSGEIRAILGPDWTVEDLNAHPEIPDIEETGVTFAENAAIKALAGSQHFPDGWVLADDSGLEVDALGGAPGVYSARYAGPGADDVTNRRFLANELWRKLGDNWQEPQSARFHCNMAVARDGKIAAQFDGTVEGHVVHPEQGKGGFGYDPVFIPVGYGETFGVLPAELKNRLSHRAAALAKAVEFLRSQPE